MFDKQSAKRFSDNAAHKAAASAVAIKLEVWLSQELQRLEDEYSDFVTVKSNRVFFKHQR